MGQKINPNSFRLGPTLNKNWASLMYAKKKYAQFFIEDLHVRKLIDARNYSQYISGVIIERPSNKSVVVNVHTKKPGALIGKSGSEIEKLKSQIASITNTEVYINIQETKKADIDAVLIAKNVASQISNRVSFRKAMKKAAQSTIKQGARGIKISCSGRLGGAEIARNEWYREGRVPLQSLRAGINYSLAEAHTTYGVIGVKVWVYYDNH